MAAFGRERDPELPSESRYCSTCREQTEHRHYAAGRGYRWRCVPCKRAEARARRDAQRSLPPIEPIGVEITGRHRLAR